MVDIKVSGTLIWYYYVCKREVWLMSRQINPNEENPFIEIGNIIAENSYNKGTKGIVLEGMAIDVILNKGETLIIGEIKKSSNYIKSSEMQLVYYLMRLKEIGISAKGQLLFPKEKKRIDVILDENKEKELKKTIYEIYKIIEQPSPPEVNKIQFCKKCAYEEFCYS
jgi:CRISPR-associated exonuclease Cas4